MIKTKYKYTEGNYLLVDNKIHVINGVELAILHMSKLNGSNKFLLPINSNRIKHLKVTKELLDKTYYVHSTINKKIMLKTKNGDYKIEDEVLFRIANNKLSFFNNITTVEHDLNTLEYQMLQQLVEILFKRKLMLRN